jgi:hypothetical protein
MTDSMNIADRCEGAEVYCARCDDSGYIETSSGGHWTGENVVTTQTICGCACGDDARDQENGTGLHAPSPRATHRRA